jgi:hypothetical protein
MASQKEPYIDKKQCVQLTQLKRKNNGSVEENNANTLDGPDSHFVLKCPQD